MRVNRTIIPRFFILSCCLITLLAVSGLSHRAGKSIASTTHSVEDPPMAQPADFVAEFPEIKWEMSFVEAKKAIAKTGATPVGFKSSQTELAWDATFNGMTGRGTVLFKEDGGAMWEIAIIVYAMEKRQDLFKAWEKKLVDKHGPPKEVQETSIDTSKVWRLKNGFAIELRVLKDDNSPAVDLHWVKL